MSWFKSFWKKLTAPVPARPETSPFDETFTNFTPRAQQVLILARKEAERLNHNFVGTEHLLLGLIKLGQGVAVNVLRNNGIDLETARTEVKKEAGLGPDRKLPDKIPYTPRVKKVLDLATKEARALNHTYVGTEHLLLGLLREGEGVAARILRNLSMDIEKTRREILKELDPNFVPPGTLFSTTSPAPPKSTESQVQGEPVDTSKRYDVYCNERNQGVRIYRNVRFKGLKHLFKKTPYDVLSDYVELEQENGQTVFVSRSSIIRFCEAGALPESGGETGAKG
jgi:hypothetical protein